MKNPLFNKCCAKQLLRVNYIDTEDKVTVACIECRKKYQNRLFDELYIRGLEKGKVLKTNEIKNVLDIPWETL